MAANVPNIEGQSNPFVATGGQFGTIIGNTTSETVGFYGAVGVAQHTATGNVTGFAAGSGTASKSDSVWTGGVGTATYTVGDIVNALKNLGILAS